MQELVVRMRKARGKFSLDIKKGRFRQILSVVIAKIVYYKKSDNQNKNCN